MLWAEVHHCSDCATQTLFVPVPEPDGRVRDGAEWCCTACDAAVQVGFATRAA